MTTRRVTTRRVTTRRALLALATIALPGAAPARPSRLTVAGPADGDLAGHAKALVEAVHASGGEPIRIEPVGTADGATAANRFTATAVADGSDLLMLPVEALMAWLAGDPRAQYEPAHWVPLAVAVQPITSYGRPSEMSRAADPTLRAAARAIDNMVRIAWLVVLPPLTDAAAAAAWRHRIGLALHVLRARDTTARLLDAPEAAELLAAAVPDEPVLLAYRGWLSRRISPG